MRGQRGKRSVVAGVAGACLATVALGVVAAAPAQAAHASASLTLGPNSGVADSPFSATFHMNARGGPAACLGGQVTFTFDATPLGSAMLDQTCTATTALAVPAPAGPGPHTIHATASGAAQNASANATFTVTGAPPATTGSTPGAPPATPTSSGSPSWSNSTTPYPGWTAPPYVSQAIPTSTGPCDTSGPHATAPNKIFLQIPAYSVGTHPATSGPTGIPEPAAGSLPILSVGPAGMIPPALGDGRHPYQNLELLETIDPNVSPKLRLAAAAGESFGCLHVEGFGGPGSGYGYLSFALKDSTVISVQDANPDGSLFQTAEPTVALPPSTPAPAATGKEKGKTPAPAPAPTPVPQAKFEKVVLGYTSLTWEYQEAAGGAQAPIHRGAGTIVPPPPPAQLSYSNLVFAFGGLVAAAVALMFAYHSRRRDLARRLRRRRASTHAS
ncbi:Ig-like domain repeat protein [Catenulispora sp. NL8]|uniref:Ig-like domain repeat protein n=1 Tax=Catenulispora pinistramenti TaxID=2705254 RepID=A0ABS5KZY5_9ACTN|nr:Ig-like domain-containing protein [Catenulispora pinistramenti]MBS2551489.1 Ig-like domain repeat protein [Catenulispora pinistramenti]